MQRPLPVLPRLASLLEDLQCRAPGRPDVAAPPCRVRDGAAALVPGMAFPVERSFVGRAATRLFGTRRGAPVSRARVYTNAIPASLPDLNTPISCP